jgi:hypothetical protein
MSTRPRISFDERGWCNACRWMETKKELNWDDRLDVLQELLTKHKKLMEVSIVWCLLAEEKMDLTLPIILSINTI